MPGTIQEIYKQSILPLSADDQLKLASLILERVSTRSGNGGRKKAGPSIRELFGKGRSGDPTGSDNEKIDADLAQTYLETHEGASIVNKVLIRELADSSAGLVQSTIFNVPGKRIGELPITPDNSILRLLEQ